MHGVPEAREKRWKFAFTRNPWARLYSVWGRQLQHPTKPTKLTFERALLTQFYYTKSSQHWAKGVDFLGRYENLKEDWDYITDHIDHPRLALPHINTSGLDEYRSHYTPEMIEFVYRNHADDVALGYEF